MTVYSHPRSLVSDQGEEERVRGVGPVLLNLEVNEEVPPVLLGGHLKKALCFFIFEFET